MITPRESRTLHCQVTHTDTDINVEYRWTRDGSVYSDNVQSITLSAGVGDSINGLYVCLVRLSAGGINQAQPVEWEVGQAVVTVGGTIHFKLRLTASLRSDKHVLKQYYNL